MDGRRRRTMQMVSGTVRFEAPARLRDCGEVREAMKPIKQLLG